MTQQSHSWAYTLRKPQFKKIHVPQMFIAALFTIARTWKQPRCPSADQWIRKLWSVSQSVQSLSPVWLFGTPWTAACQASLSITRSWSLLKLMSIELVMPSNHLIFHCPLFLTTFNLSQHQGLFKWVISSHLVAKVLEFQLQHQSFQWIFRTDFL